MKKCINLCLLLFLFFSCSKNDGTPASLTQILNRNEVTTSGGGTGGSGSGVGGGAPAKYQGAYATDIRTLLSRVSGWKTASCLSCNDGVPPKVPVGANCIRDTYVAAAVNYAWAAESYYRLGNTSQAASMATQMAQSLQMAKNLCGNGPGFGGATCLTFSIYPC